MTGVVAFFAAQWQGLLVIALLLCTTVLVVQWIAWIFSRGRFRAKPAGGREITPLRHVFADLIVKIIDDFRHLLALLIVLIFAATLVYALVLASYDETDRLGAASTALQAVVSSMGGLIGAIIGYYFGEKAGERQGRALEVPTVAGPAVQAPPTESGRDRPASSEARGIRPAPAPPGG